MDGLKPGELGLSQFWKPEIQNQVSWGWVGLEAMGETVIPASSGFGWG